jgi:glycosyltransferase involved in cell wall biosynthesis
LLNDQAAVQWQLGNLEGALELLEEALKDYAPFVLAYLNHQYLAEVKNIKGEFDFKLEHINHDLLKEKDKIPRVSVIVRTCIRRELLGDALQSLAEQTFQDFETIVVNDGGEGDMEEVVKSSGLRNVRYFLAPQGGPWSAMNYGLEMSRGEFITFFDDDDILYPDHLEVLVSYLEKPGSCPVAYPDAVVSWWTRDKQGLYKRIKAEEKNTHNFNRDELFRTNYINSVLLMARRGCFDDAGRFCSMFPAGGDWEMWLRLSEHYPFHHIKRFTAEVRIFQDEGRVTSRHGLDKFHWDNLLLFMHRGLALFSFSRLPEHERAYRRAMAELDRILNRHPELRSKINLRGLWDERHPYAYFADQARWFIELEKPGLAWEFARSARRLRWYEPKNIMLTLRSRIRGR